jgi:hypothetical protein
MKGVVYIYIPYIYIYKPARHTEDEKRGHGRRKEDRERDEEGKARRKRVGEAKEEKEGMMRGWSRALAQKAVI